MAALTRAKPHESKSDAVSMSMDEAVKLLSREERFMATVAAMNTLLIERRIYTQQEFDVIFSDWAQARTSKSRKQRHKK